MISSIQNEKVKYWVSLKDKKNRDLNKEYLIEGEHLVFEAYKSGYLKTIIYEGKLDSKYKNIESIEVNEAILKKICTTQTPQRIAGIARYFEEKDNYLNGKIILLDGVQDPGNAGTIVRNSLAFGYNLVFFSNNSVDIYNSKFIRATQGSFYSIRLFRGDQIEFVNNLLNNSYDVIATCLAKDSKNINDVVIKDNHCLVFGNEGNGVSLEIINKSTKKVIIPMSDKIDSLNVAVASGILMYKLSKF